MFNRFARWLGLGKPSTGRGLREQAEDDAEDEKFNTLWIQNLVGLALERLMVETRAGGPRYYEALGRYRAPDYRGVVHLYVAEEWGLEPDERLPVTGPVQCWLGSYDAANVFHMSTRKPVRMRA